MTIKEYFELEKRMSKVREELQSISDDFNVSFHGDIEMTMQDTSSTWQGFNITPNN